MASAASYAGDCGLRKLATNRMRRGGVLAVGASFKRLGENGKGIASSWHSTR